MSVPFPAALGKTHRVYFAALVLVVAGATGPARAEPAIGAIVRIGVVEQRGGTTVRISFSAPAVKMPKVFAFDAPLRLVLDFADTSGSVHRSEGFAEGLVETAGVLSMGDHARVVLALRQPVRQVLRLQDGDLLVDLTASDLGTANAVSPVPGKAATGQVASGKPGKDDAKGSEEKKLAGNGTDGNGKSAKPETLLVEIEINGQPLLGIFRVERLPNGRLALPLEAWQAAHLRAVGEPIALPDGQRGYTLESVPDLKYRVDRGRLALSLTVPAAAFDANAYSLADPQVSPPNRAPLGFYLNYGFDVTRREGASATYGGLLEGILFNSWGSLVSGVVVSGDGQSNSAVRTETYFRKDWPGSMETLIVGDAVGSAGGWSRPVRFGGVLFARDYSLAPGYITYPVPSVSGSAALPSTVDVLVNNQRQATANVKPGPFDLTNVPVVTGAGQINLVVRDLRGVETVITQSYYTSPRLLAPGLSDFSAEAGSLRNNFGSESNDYHSVFAAGSYRYGFSPALTAGGRLEIQSSRQAGGGEVVGLLGTFAIARVAAAWAHSNGEYGSGDNSGAHWAAGIERSTPQAGAAVQYERFDKGFIQFGATSSEIRPRELLQANAGVTIMSVVSLGASYVRQTSWNGDRFSLAGANVGIALPHNAYLSLFASEQVGVIKGWTAGLNLLIPLDFTHTIVATSNRDTAGNIVNAVQATSATPPGPGWGWTVRASDLETQRAQAGVTLNTNYGQFTAEANAGKDTNAVRVGANGSLGWLEGLPFATRRIEQGAFAVVRVADLEGVPVSLSNQVMATTNGRGLALIPNLLPYQKNILTVNPDQLPFDITIGGVEEAVVPYARSGVIVNFPVKRSRNALLTLRQADGVPVPAGAHVIVSPGDQEFIVAKRGEVYLMDLQNDNRIDVRWKDGSCSLPLPLDPAKGGEQQVGPLVCGGRP